jgi:glycosyltransferase involved in cell wall biosynthesis
MYREFTFAMPPRVSIITRTKDRPLLLQRALASVQGQRYTDWQHVIVNDGGEADPVDALVESQPAEIRKRIQVLHHPESLGMQDASNAGIRAAEGEFVCIHDDDDRWEPDYLEAVIAFLDGEGPDSPYQGVITGTTEVRETVAEAGELKELSRRPYIPLEEISLFRMGYENPFPPIAFCYRRSAWEAIGGYDRRWDVVGDMDFNLRFLLKFEIGVIPRNLAFYHIREDTANGTLANSVEEKRALHKRLFNEFKNTHLRSVDSPGDSALALGLSVAPYLVESQWMLDTVFHRTRETREALDTLSRSLSLEGFEDRFGTIREALAILIDHARDPGVKNGLTGLQKGLEDAAAARQATAARLEELVRATGMPSEGEDFETVRQALGILLEQTRQPGIREGLEGLWKQLEAAAAARQATAGRLEELIRTTGLQEPGDDRPNFLQAMNRILDFIEDPESNGQAFRKALDLLLGQLEERQNDRLETLETRILERLDVLERLDQRIEAMEARLDRVESGALKLWMGPIKLGRVGRSPKKD